jgi:hypothetical protein
VKEKAGLGVAETKLWANLDHSLTLHMVEILQFQNNASVEA